MESPKTNGSTTVRLPSNGSPTAEEPEEKLSLGHSSEIQRLEPKTKNQRVKQCLFENLLTLATLLGVVLGIALGLGLRSAKQWSQREIMYINFPGELFLSMLKCLILPLIVSSLIAAVGSLDTKLTGKIGSRAVFYYISTTIIAIILGIILVLAIRPGEGTPGNIGEEAPAEKYEAKPTLAEDTLMDLVRNMFPPNILEAAIRQHSTVIQEPETWNKTKNETTDADKKEWEFERVNVEQTNILGMVVFSIVLGLTLARMKNKGKPLLDVFVALSDAMMFITKAVIWLSPVGIMFLVTSKILEMKDLNQVVGQIGLYSVTVFCGVMGHGFIVLPLIYLAMVRKNPITFIVNMGQAMATAFGTSSSSATLPVTITCLEEKNLVDPRVSRFCLPIGATINMDGTALYEAVAAIFISQVRGIDLSIGNIVAISITATAASIGAAGIPQAGLVTMVMVLNVVGLPAEDVTLILIVDWILDRFRTMVNVLGDSFGSAIVEHYSKNDLAEIKDIPSSMEMTTL